MNKIKTRIAAGAALVLAASLALSGCSSEIAPEYDKVARANYQKALENAASEAAEREIIKFCGTTPEIQYTTESTWNEGWGAGTAFRLSLYYDLSNGAPANIKITEFELYNVTKGAAITTLVSTPKEITIPINGSYNYQELIPLVAAANKSQISLNDKVKITMKGTSDVAIDEFKCVLLENSAGNNWNTLSGYCNTGIAAESGKLWSEY